jgi:hypothetical protein
MTIELDKITIVEFDNLSQQDKNTYIIWLLSIPEQNRTSIDKHILKFNSVGVNQLEVLVLEE